MSADNWAVCPRCLDVARAARNARVDEAAAAYGVVTSGEYEALRERIGDEVTLDSMQATFQEDYEIYGVDTGTVTVSYSGCCSTCRLSLDFKDEHPYYTTPEAPPKSAPFSAGSGETRQP